MPLSNKISGKIADELSLDKDQREVINYGAFAVIQITASLAVVALLGFLLGVLPEALVVSFSMSILRQFSGGGHASRPAICVVIGTIVTISIALFAHYAGGYLDGYAVSVAAVLFYIWSFYTVLKRAPVDSAAKPISSEAKRKIMKRVSLIILSVYILLTLLLVYLFIVFKDVRFSRFAFCVFGGAAWQAFTLTSLGNHSIAKIDNWLVTLFFGKENI